MRVAVVQPSYIPWKGYFDLIAAVDHFVLYDDVQYTRRDWRNRNRVKGPDGPIWLTIPVRTRGAYHQTIDAVEIADPAWAERHWATLRRLYAGAPCFGSVAPWLERLFTEAAGDALLVDVCERFTRAVCARLGVTTPITRSSELAVDGARTERLVSVCSRLDATEYLSGPSAREYLDEGLFAAAGIDVAWADYSDYPEYAQLNGPFVHEVTVLDLLLNTGDDAPRHLKHARVVEGVRS